MHTLRRLLVRHFAMALVMVMAALCMKALVPVGYMVRSDSAVLSVQICGQTVAGEAMQRMLVPIKHDGGDSGSQQAKNDCPFASAPVASVPAVDGQLLAGALLFILALGYAAVRPARPARILFLRPPLRGPPALA